MAYKNKQYPTIKDVLHHPEQELTGNVLLNIRGTNGSGKSYTVCEITKGRTSTLKMIDGIKVYDYGDFYVIGSYDKACGGLDTITDFYAIDPLVQKLIKDKHVLMDGLLWSGVFRASHKLSEAIRKEGHQMLWLCMDTTAHKCIDNVMRRRATAGNFKPLDTNNLIKKMIAVTSCHNHAIYYNENVFVGKTDEIVSFANEIIATGRIDKTKLRKEYFFFEGVEEIAAKPPIVEVPADIRSEVSVKMEKASNSLFDLFGA